MRLLHLVAAFGLLAVFFVASPVFADRHGYISSASCPYSCRTQGIDKRNCRDWKNGNTCFVEDLNRAPAAPPIAVPHAPPFPTRPGIRPDNPINPANSSCDVIDRSAIAPPSIYIADVKTTGNFVGSKLKVRGYVEGICLAEAGGYENGRRVASIPLTKTASFKRFEFAVTVDGRSNPEIRGYNINGERDIYEVESTRYGPESGSGSTWSW